jgi:hypothetical protein
VPVGTNNPPGEENLGQIAYMNLAVPTRQFACAVSACSHGISRYQNNSNGPRVQHSSLDSARPSCLCQRLLVRQRKAGRREGASGEKLAVIRG